jgi:hypothetical protein
VDPKKSDRVRKLKSKGVDKASVVDGNVVVDVSNTLLKEGNKEMNEEVKIQSGVGLDVGTAFLVSARLNEKSETVFKSYRDAFYTITPVSAVNTKFIEKGLTERNFDFVYSEGVFTVAGEGAVVLANERMGSVKRPLSRGVISPKERQSIPMLKRIIQSLVGAPTVKGEKCVYSVPAPAVDNDMSVVYHTTVINNFLFELGYTPIALNEGEAICYSELMDSDLSGIAVSWGAGMANLCIMSSGDPLVRIAVGAGGDFIDLQTSKSTDITPELAQQEKESESFDLNNPKGHIQEALVIHYTDLIEYVLKQAAYELNKLKENKKLPIFKNSISIVVSGGTSKPTGFLSLLNMCMAKIPLPIDIKEIRQAKDVLNSVAKGCLLYATME